ncbi:cell division protein FtsZ, partial [Candidatus Aminicenantes bacterium AC-335-O07]|nr:cell division protein FtsZ [Candidatus Aminicenantes bacterium AC-335-O07]
FAVVNTDLQALNQNKAKIKVQIGAKLTNGLGSGGDPEVGRQAALEDTEKLIELIDGADMIFLTAGLGGGTGTGATPVIANLASEKKILTVAIVTKPFNFEGRVRAMQAIQGLKELKETADTVIAIPNERLLETVNANTTLEEAFKLADDVLRQAVQGIADLITRPGLINLDFADVKAIMSYKGMSFMGTGVGTGENRALEAAEKAISSPLLVDISIEGAKGVLINISGGNDLSLLEVHKAAELIHSYAHPDANIIVGALIDESLKGKIKITVIATGFENYRLEEDYQTPYFRTPTPFPVKNKTPILESKPPISNALWGMETPDREWKKYETPPFLRNKHASLRKTANSDRED